MNFDFNGPKMQGSLATKPPVSILVRCFDYANHKSSIAQQAFPEGVVKAEQDLNSAGVLGNCKSASDVVRSRKGHQTHDVRVKSGDRLPAPTRKSGTQQKQDALAQVWLCAPATDHCWGYQFHRRFAQASAGVPRGFTHLAPRGQFQRQSATVVVMPLPRQCLSGTFTGETWVFPSQDVTGWAAPQRCPAPGFLWPRGLFIVRKRMPRGGAHA
jgi:hypothetical protein